MRILITGIGITGKSTLRRKLVKLFRSQGLEVVHYDADEFKELRDEADRDCHLPENFSEEKVYLIEDIHGPTQEALLPLESYNLILYLKTDFFSQILFWLPRMWRWFLLGHFSWEQYEGWRGTGKSCDPRNIIPIIKDFIRDFKNRDKWVSEDLNIIKPLPHLIIESRWTRRGPKFRLEL